MGKRRGLFVEEAILRNERLKVDEKLVLAFVELLSSSGACWAGNAHLARELGLSPREVQRCLARLVALGYVTRRVEVDGSALGGRRRWLRLTGLHVEEFLQQAVAVSERVTSAMS